MLLHAAVLCSFSLLYCYIVLKKKVIQWYLLNYSKEGFMHFLAIGICNAAIRFCSVGGEIGLDSEYRPGKWEFIAKEQGRDQWVENY